MSNRFAQLSEEDKRCLLLSKDSKSTQKGTQVAWLAFKQWLSSKNLDQLDVSSITETELDNVLKDYFLELRKQKLRKNYAKTAYRAMRHGLQRKFKELRSIDIINDPDFKSSGNAFVAQCVDMKKKGLAKIKHKDITTKHDLEKLYDSKVLSNENPKSLVRKVFFDLMYFFCRRAMENLRSLKIDTFSIKKDENGLEYVTLNIDEFEKNHGAFSDGYDGGVMYTTGSETCPVFSFKLYFSKLNPKIEAFFQRPKEIVPYYGPWFDAQVIGIKTLSNMMKTISTDAGFSKIYMNHCIRATCITTLDNNGFEARHIMSITGHKSETSIRAYSKTGLETKKRMCDVLSNSATPRQILLVLTE